MFKKSFLNEDQLEIEKERTVNFSLEETPSSFTLKYKQGKSYWINLIMTIDLTKANDITSKIDNQLISPSLDEFDNDKLLDKFKQEFWTSQPSKSYYYSL